MASSHDIQQYVARAAQAFTSGNADTALKHANQALAGDPHLVGALYIKALAQRILGDPGAAKQALETALSVNQNAAEIHNVLGLCEQDLGQDKAAQNAFETAERLDPGFLHAPFNLARLLFDAGERRAAAQAYERALSIDPNHVDSLRGLAHALNVLRDFERAEAVADLALALMPSDAVALSVKGGAMLRAGNADGAVALIRGQLKPQEGGAMNVSLALGVLGEAYDQLGAYTDALKAWGFGNERLRQNVEAHYENSEAPYSLTVAQRLAAAYGRATQTIDSSSDGPSPVFLVGFPRSGTTLLENVLAAHPAIQTSEEQPHAEGIVLAAGASEDSIAELLAKDGTELEALRRQYWQSACPDGPPIDGQVFIDKLPLNLNWIGVLAHVFPGAKFILALRDPRDCVLSSFQQRFVMNPSMYRMLRMDDAARYYDAAFSAAEAARRALPGLAVHEVRYEDVVDDLEAEARKAIAFLGLNWDGAVMDYRDTAKTRAINTPSAPQVDQPIYTQSVDRWRQYAFVFEGEVAAILDPWIERWGYDA